MRKIALSWQDMWGEGNLFPICSTQVPDDKPKGNLGSYLMDDGGCGFEHLIRLNEHTIEQVEKFKQGKTGVANISSESWGVDIEEDHVNIYFIYDDSYYNERLPESYDVIPLDSFEKALLAWRDFLQTEPSLDNTMEMEI